MTLIWTCVAEDTSSMQNPYSAYSLWTSTVPLSWRYTATAIAANLYKKYPNIFINNA